MISSSDKKKQLLKQSVLYKEEFEEEFKLIKNRTDDLLKKVLVIGGSLAVTYLLFRQLSNSKRKQKRVRKNIDINPDEGTTEDVIFSQPPSQFALIASEIGANLANQATSFLLQVAKDKLMELLQPKETNQEEDEDS